MKEILKKIRDYEIRIRKAINTQMQGDFHSVFKGSGLEFDEVRQYQYGDDIRHIDWNVSAKGFGTFVKTFKEDKEQNVFFLLDVSASQEVGKGNTTKLQVAKEICGVLALSAIREASNVGVLCFSDTQEQYIKTEKGIRHAYLIIKRIFQLKPQSQKTNLSNGLKTLLNILKRRSLVIVISDFVDSNYEKHLKAVAHLHDLIVIHVYDKREAEFPDLGIVPLWDVESKKTIWVNTSSRLFRIKRNRFHTTNVAHILEICRKNEANYVNISTQEDYVPKLIRLFKVRNKIRK
ncbi:MAG: DUF58 domain-containing protein [Cytophagales bacterium]|nr:DUF58 domain-containing protein [Cytophagales bacterium]MDW8385090.1 DUF58 domain-containing protein [Flammeovirgaceae bacterium]